MLYMTGSGAPLLPSIANFFASKGLRLIYTFIIMAFYFGFDVIVVTIAKKVNALKEKKHNN